MEPTAFDITPISDPIELTPLIFPSNETPRSLECAFPYNQRMWIVNRDGGYSNMPTFDEHGDLTGLSKDVEGRLEVHHLTPQHYYIKQFGKEKALKYMHNPLNGITLDSTNHARIHCDWMYQYKTEYEAMSPRYCARASLQDYVKWQVEQGRPNWLTAYDGIFSMIATIRTVMYVDKVRDFPFKEDEYDLAVAWYTRMCASKSEQDQEWRKRIEEIVVHDYEEL
ncbi:MAG: hypothetical protein NUV65_05715 [Candidatus Roizmanbacteria bacterium]|nr:hypothetical protein [Candidatus Roizmanbacteria bacterium]